MSLYLPVPRRWAQGALRASDMDAGRVSAVAPQGGEAHVVCLHNHSTGADAVRDTRARMHPHRRGGGPSRDLTRVLGFTPQGRQGEYAILSGVVSSLTPKCERGRLRCGSGNVPLLCAQSVYDAKIVADRPGLDSVEWERMRDKVRIFRNFAGAQAYSDNMMRHERTDPNGWQRLLVEDCSIGL